MHNDADGSLLTDKSPGSLSIIWKPGNTAEARRIAQALRRDQNLTPKQLETTLRESIDAHRPIPTGTGGTAFIRWPRRSLPTEELVRMHHIERVYERTAERAGLPVKPESSGSGPLASAINALFQKPKWQDSAVAEQL